MSGSRRRSNQRSGRNRRSNNKSKKPALDPREFWGDGEAMPDELAPVVMAEDPSAVVRSLGRPPIHGQENVAEHYFRAVYGRAANLAVALAAAGGLIGEPGDDDDADSADNN